jgi:hypothetical protein
MPPRTIDNLGVEVSTRYAEDKQVLDETMVKGARAISVQTVISVTAPSFPSEVEALLHIERTHLPWANFVPPEHYFEQRKQLFTFQLIPSLGSEDKKESQSLKILSKLRSMAEEAAQTGKPEEEGRDKKILTSLLNTIAIYDKLIIETNSKRGQYHKG